MQADRWRSQSGGKKSPALGMLSLRCLGHISHWICESGTQKEKSVLELNPALLVQERTDGQKRSDYFG